MHIALHVCWQQLSAQIDVKLMQSTQLLTQLDRRYLVSYSDSVVYPPELSQPVEELRAIIAALPSSVDTKISTLDIISSRVIEYISVSEAAENLLKAVDNGSAVKEPFGTASEQLREQQVSGFSVGRPIPEVIFFVEKCHFVMFLYVRVLGYSRVESGILTM